MKKRILGLFLCLVMCLSLIPTTALAATYTSSSTVALKDLSVGDIINGSMTLTNEALRASEVVRPIWCEIFWLERSDQTATAAFAERVLINFPSNNPQTVQVPEKYSHVESWTIKQLSPLDGIENRTIVVYPTNHSAHNFLYSAQSADTIMASCIATGCPLKTAPTFTLVAEDAVVSSKETYTATLSNWRDFSNHTDEVATPSIQYNMVIDGTIGAETTGGYIINHVGTYCASVTFKDVTVRKNFNILASAPVAVTGVTLNKTSASIVAGTTETLTATVAPDNATNKNVTWTSSDEGVATVADGVVTAVAAGTATITATTVEGGFSATCTVTVTPVAVTGVTLNKTSASIVAGTTETLTATVAPDNATNKNVTWTSSDEGVATVADGVVTAVAAGTATITVTTEDGGKTATCEVTVTEAPADVDVTGVTLNETTASIVAGETTTLTATVAPADATNKNVTWTSSDEGVATVADGVVTAVAAGTATITVTTEDGGKTATCAVTVTKKASGGSSSGSSAPATYAVKAADSDHGSVTVSPKSASAGDTVKVTVNPDKGYTLETITVTDKNGKEVALTATEIGETYTFKMPSGGVEITATFMEDNTMLNYFVDVTAEDYYYDAVLWAAENGITSGVDAVHFDPNAGCTRAQVVTFLWRAAGCPEPESAGSFADVNADAYYTKAIAWAAEQGITGGTSATTFSPDATCTRAQIMTFLYRFNGQDTLEIKDNPFGDVAEGQYYSDAVLWGAKNGITGGTTATTFSPDATCTRAQIVTFLYRYMGK